jgi:hypothetical protein
MRQAKYARRYLAEAPAASITGVISSPRCRRGEARHDPG